MTIHRLPLVKIHDIDGNAFRLLLRVRNAIREAYPREHKINAVNELNAKCGAAFIVTHSTIETPRLVYERLLLVAREFCQIASVAA